MPYQLFAIVSFQTTTRALLTTPPLLNRTISSPLSSAMANESTVIELRKTPTDTAKKSVAFVSSLFQEFKDFILRGHVVDLAIAFIMSAAFLAVVNSVVTDLI